MDFDGSQFLNTEQFVTLTLPVTAGQFSPILENHIARRIIPGESYGRLNPLEDDVWIFLHGHPLSELNRTFAVITHPEGMPDTVIEDGVLPMLERRFGIHDRDCHNCIARLRWKIVAYLHHQFTHCQGQGQDTAPITVTSPHDSLCITFYPRDHACPILVLDGEEMYIVPETALPGRWVDNPPWLADLPLSDTGESDEEKTDPEPRKRARMAIAAPVTASTFIVRKKDP